MPRISIVLPTYNGERYIRESIDSVLQQTFTDWELIIVDDCSTDSTPKLVEEYAATDSRIQVIHNAENRKLPESLNIGFRQAQGEYLTWTSDDNVYLTHALENMCKYLDCHMEIPMVCAGVLLMDENMRYLREGAPYDQHYMYIGNAVGACFLYRRAVLNDVGEYSTEFFCAEDYEYWIRIIQRYGSIGYIENISYLYRWKQPNSLSVTKADQVQNAHNRLRLKYFDWILSGIHNDKAALMEIYGGLLKTGYMTGTLKVRFEELIPELNGDSDLNPAARIVIYGAGQIGEKVFAAVKDDAMAFADSSPAKVGLIKCGLPILSPEELKNLYQGGNCQVVIATDYKWQFEIIQRLQTMGITRYTICSRLF